MAQRSLRGLGASALAPCHLAKHNDPDIHSSLCPQKGELCPATATMRPLGTTSRAKFAFEPTFEPLMLSTVQFDSRHHPQRSRQMRPTRCCSSSDRFFAYFGTSGRIAASRPTTGSKPIKLRIRDGRRQSHRSDRYTRHRVPQPFPPIFEKIFLTIRYFGRFLT